MRAHSVFLLVYLLGSCSAPSNAQRNETCSTGGACEQGRGPTSDFLQCVGLSSEDTGRDHMRRLKGMLEAAMDVYTFMKSSMTGVPLLSLQGELALNPDADPLQNEDLVQMWMEVKINPLLKSINKHFLSCLSNKPFSCPTYQTVVRELSDHYSEMDPIRQQWIYTFFMQPFLSGDRVAGCALPQQSSEEWLMKNFGAFRAMARLQDLSTLNMVFSGLEVLHLLSPAQKAELLLRPEVAGLDNGTLNLVFHSLLTGGPPPTANPGEGDTWTTPGEGHNWTTPGQGHIWTTPGEGHNWTTPGEGNNWTTPGKGHNWTTPGEGNNWTTPGEGHNWTTPGEGNNWTTPGKGHNWTTPGQGHIWTTPGEGHNWTTPGEGNNWTTPGKGHNWTTPGEGNNWTTPGEGHNWTTPGEGNNWTTPGKGHNWTTPGYPYIYPPYPTYPPPSPQNSLREVVSGFMTAFKPIGSFVHDFVSFTQERNVSEVKSTTLTQFLLNWTLAELADMYRPQNSSQVPETPEFDVTNVEDWYQQVVVPVLRRFLPDDGTLMHQNVKLAFHQVFYLDHGVMDDDASEVQDVCSITLNNRSCGLTDAVVNVAKVMHCAAGSNLTLSEETVLSLMGELTERLSLLIQELLTSNFTEVASDFQQIFGEVESPSLTQEHLEDPDFLKLWFQIKLMPLLPIVPRDLLSCLSTKNFSCPGYQTIVAAFSKHNYKVFSDDPIYKYFFYPFLMNHNTSDPQCVSSANNSTEWLTNNFGDYVVVPSITDFYELNPNFSGLEVLPLLTSTQIAEMLLLPLPTPPEKDVVIDRVFDFLLASPENRQFTDVLRSLSKLTYEIKAPCDVYKHIFERLYAAIPLVPPDFEPDVWTGIEDLRAVVPDECLPANLTCQMTSYNDTNICRGVNSSDLLSYVSISMEVPCSFSLETYACAQLENFTANQLVSLLKCNLPGNSMNSKVLWKLLLTKLSSVLDPALDLLADMSTTAVVPSASAVLDVIGELRVSMLTDEQLRNSSVIRLWFSGRLSAFLPFPSGMFLQCLSRRNLSCQSYQQILQEFINHFDDMTTRHQYVVAKDFALRFLSRPHSGPGCVSASNGSAEWLMKNLGPFSRLLYVRELLPLDPDFNPVDVLHLLSPAQSAELLVLILPDSPEKDAAMNMIFDNLTPDGILDFLYNLDKVQSEMKTNLSCSSQKTLFTRLDSIMPTVPLEVMSSIVYYQGQLSRFIPPGCIINSGECNVIMTNETDICVGVNRTTLQLQLDSRQMSGRFCDFAVEELACASLSALTADDLAALLVCNRSASSSGSRPAWKLLLSKASHVLDRALDRLTNTTLDPMNPAVPLVLDSIQEVLTNQLVPANLSGPAFVQLWSRLRPFLPAVTPEFLSCLSTKTLDCVAYQQMVQILSSVQPRMTLARQISVYTRFIKAFLTRTNATASELSCSVNVNSSGEWLQQNLAGFSVLASFRDLQMLYSNFSAMSALPQLTVRQLADVSATPGQLASAAQVLTVMRHVPDRFLPAFFDDFSPAVMGQKDQLPSAVRSAMLQVVFDRANLSDPSVADPVVSLWLGNRLRPLLVNLLPEHVAPFFRILAARHCSIEQQGVGDLNATISSLSERTKGEIHNHIVQTLKGPRPLNCYVNNQSFYSFLQRSFMGFQFPNLTTFLSLMPPNRTHQLVNSIPPSALGDFFRRPDVVDNETKLCVVYDHYNQTPAFLQNESLPAEVRRPTLPCFWRSALSSSERSEVNAWFDQRLRNYLVFLTKSLISPNSTHNASCLAFQKLVSVLGNHNYTGADFMRRDVFDTIRAYLASATVPRCYDPSNPELNSTAWFAEYIGPFMPFLTLEDLQTFGSAPVIQVFTVNPLNLAVLNHTALPVNLTNYYTDLVYQQDSNFNPLLLPLSFRCVAPGPAFSQLTAAQSVIVLYNLTTLCSSLDPQVAAALAGNLGNNIDAAAISALGNESTGMSTGQIKNISPQQMLDALGTLSGVTGWNKGQAKAIVQLLLSSGAFQINGTSLFTLGSLIVGVPAKEFGKIGGAQLLTASKDPLFLEHMMLAPQIIRQTFVAQIISADSSAEAIIQNVPDEMASEIPRALLLGFSNNGSVIKELNKKKWKRQQVELFFDVIAVESATAELGGPNNLSSSVLQGFTCTGVRTVESAQIKKLIKACRRNGKNRVLLVETQLTCMYNHIKGDSEAGVFDLYPPDMLLYYDYSLVPPAGCRSYFEQLSEADFSVFSSALSYKRTALFANARSCLGITNTSLTEDHVSVLGNMCCTLDASYIQNSDPSVLEKFKSCPDLSDAQAAAVEALLQGGKTQYGPPSTWTEQTLKDLGMLPLYLTPTFYDNFDKKTKRTFLRYFLKELKSNGVDRQDKSRLKKDIGKSIKNRSKRSIVNECTVGTITQVTVSDETFPLDYDDVTQFNCCLSASTVRDNLEAITGKVDQEEHLRVVLSKLREVYSTLPEDAVQLLGPASRVATMADVNAWEVTQIDTLAALMDAADGPWDASLAKAVISKYLSHAGNKLGSAELNVIGGANLCSLDADVLKNISQQSIREANAPTLSNCTAEKKKQLFAIAQQAFASNTRSTISAASYGLTQPYIGGADPAYVRSLAASNINMDMAAFTSLDENLVLNLTVTGVKGLLGTNLADLQLYQNQTLVNNWISRQSQSELNSLAIGLVGGKVDATATTVNSGAATGTPTTVNTGAATGSPTTVNSGAATGTPTTVNSGAATGSPTTVNSGAATGSPTTVNSGAATGSPTTVNSGAATGTPTTVNSGAATGSPTTVNSGAATGSPTTVNSGAATGTPTTVNSGTPTRSPTTVTSTSTTTTSNGGRLRADAGFSFLAVLTLLIASGRLL